jgi:hypothetical protein
VALSGKAERESTSGARVWIIGELTWRVDNQIRNLPFTDHGMEPGVWRCPDLRGPTRRR